MNRNKVFGEKTKRATEKLWKEKITKLLIVGDTRGTELTIHPRVRVRAT